MAKRRKFILTITQARLKELVSYNPATGTFVWLADGPMHSAGDRVGWYSSGYLCVTIDGEDYRLHRLAWLYVHGRWPADQLDHKDLVRDHNWIDNLREANNVQNNCNQRLRPANTSGFKGVSFCKQTGRWAARIRYQGRKRHLGRFDTPELAGEMYVLAATMIQGEFARLED